MNRVSTRAMPTWFKLTVQCDTVSYIRAIMRLPKLFLAHCFDALELASKLFGHEHGRGETSLKSVPL